MNTEFDDLSTAGEGRGRERETNITKLKNNCKYQTKLKNNCKYQSTNALKQQELYQT